MNILYMPFDITVNLLQTMATVSMFLACKAEETPRLLRDVIIMAYEMTNGCDRPALERIRQRVWFHCPCFLVSVLSHVVCTLTLAYCNSVHRKFLISRRN